MLHIKVHFKKTSFFPHELDISVPCEKRAQLFYKDYLERFPLALIRALEEKKLLDFVDGAKLAFDPELLATLAEKLDDCVVEFLRVRWLSDSGSLHSEADHQRHYEQYFASTSQDEATTLILQHMLEKIYTAFLDNNILVAITRTYQERKLIQAMFSPQASHPIFLTKIKTTEGDWHHDGKQVLILSFQLRTSVTGNSGHLFYHLISPNKPIVFKVVYKPTDMRPQLMFNGDTTLLNQLIFSAYKKSLSELLNEKISEPELHLPLMRILPCQDADESLSEKPQSHFGYSEYLSHEPWPTVAELEIEYHLLKKGIRDPNILREAVINRFLEKLSAVLKTYTQSDFVFRSRSELTIFFKTLGILAALAYVIGLGDLHVSNMMVSRRKPLIFDAEVILSHAINSRLHTNMFDLDAGLLTANTVAESSAVFRNGLYITDGLSLTSRIVLANNVVMFQEHPNSQLIAVKLDDFPNDFCEGCEYGLQLICENKNLLLDQLKHYTQQSIYCRALLDGTGNYEHYQISFLRHMALGEQWINYQVSTQGRALSECIQKWAKYFLLEVASSVIGSAPNSEIPRYLALSRLETIAQWIMASIPSFYRTPNHPSIIDGQNRKLLTVDEVVPFMENLYHEVIEDFQANRKKLEGKLLDTGITSTERSKLEKMLDILDRRFNTVMGSYRENFLENKPAFVSSSIATRVEQGPFLLNAMSTLVTWWNSAEFTPELLRDKLTDGVPSTTTIGPQP